MSRPRLLSLALPAEALTVIPLPTMTASAIAILALIMAAANFVASGKTSSRKRLRAGMMQQTVPPDLIVPSNSTRLQFAMISFGPIVRGRPCAHPDYFNLNHDLSFAANSTLLVGGTGGFTTTVVHIDSRRLDG